MGESAARQGLPCWRPELGAARARLEKALILPLSHSAASGSCPTAIGAALSLPTASLEIYADTGKGTLWVPALGFRENIGRNSRLRDAKSALSRLRNTWKEWRGRCQRGSCGGRFFLRPWMTGAMAQKGHPGLSRRPGPVCARLLYFPDAGCAGRAGNSPNTGNIARLCAAF